MTQAPAPLGPSQAFPVVPVSGLSAGVLATIPYPTNLPVGPTPVQLPYCVLNNSSPFTLLVTQGGNLSQIPAFTADVVHVLELGSTQGITVLPQATAAVVAVGADTSVYATWYSGQPPGTYPAAIGAGTTPLAQTVSIYNSAVAGIPAGGTTIGPASSPPLSIPTWAQAVAIRFDITSVTGGANGLFLNVNDSASGLIGFMSSVLGFSQWAFVPIGATSIQITLASLVNLATGGTVTGTLRVLAMAGPVLGPSLSASSSGIGQVASASPATTVRTTLINRPPTGFAIRVHRFHWRVLTAPAAGNVVQVLGTTSSKLYDVYLIPAAVTYATADADYVVGQSGQTNPFEGLDVQNNTNQTVPVSIDYDLVPAPFTFGQT